MSTPAIRVENLGKKYLIRHQQERAHYKSLREELATRVKSFLPNGKKAAPGTSSAREDFWALRNIGFEVDEGEAVGIIGRNGAGKSTLLKLLSRITEPSEGRIEIEGRIASLLEVGTGFHAELTGRENIYLNGAILGMTKAEIKRKFDEIIAFAEVEKFLDTPVKRYSSGMYMRLAFAVAAHLEPEILIVDEVLAVGDAAFQKKCLGRMREVSTQGRTVLFVSHNMGAITSLCQKAYWLDGELVGGGPVREVVDNYLTTNTDSLVSRINLADVRRNADHGKRFRIESLEWLTPLPLQHGQPFSARIHFNATDNVEEVSVGLGFSTMEGVRLLTYETDFQAGVRFDIKAGGRGVADLTVSELPLAPGMYSLDIGSRSSDFYALDYIPNFIQAEIAMGPKTPGTITRQGAGVRLPGNWEWSLG